MFNTLWQWRKKFSVKLFFIFVLISIIPLLVISASSYFITIKTRQKNIAEMQNLAISNAYEKVTKYVNQKMEGLNLIVSGKGSENELPPASLTSANPNHLIFLIKKRWQKENNMNDLESISFLGQNGEIILQMDKNNKIKLKNYFGGNIPIIHDQVSLTDNIYDPKISGLNLDANDPYSLAEMEIKSGFPEVWLSAPVQNQNGQNIGMIVTEINLANLINKIKAPLTIEKNVAELSGLTYDNSIELIKENRRRYGEWLDGQGANIISASLISRSGRRIVRLDDNRVITLKVYSDEEIKTLDASIQIDNGLNLPDMDASDPAFNSIISGQNPYKININNLAGADGQTQLAYLKYLSPILNAQKEAIGLNEIDLSLDIFKNSQTAVKLGDSLKRISEIDPNTLIYLLKNVKTVSGADNSVRDIKFIDETGEALAAIGENDLITIKKDYWRENLPSAAILPAYLSQVREVDFIDENFASTTEFKTAIYGQNYLGPLEFADNKAIMSLASQFQNNDNETIGIVAAEVYLSPLENIIKEIKLGNTGYLYLLDSNGFVIASPNNDFARVGQNLNDINLVKNVLNGQTYDGLKRFTEYANQLDQKVIFAGQPMKTAAAAEGVNWFIFSEWPRDDAFSVLKYILQVSLIISLAMLFIVLVLGAIFSQSIVRPIRSLVLAAQEIAKGNLDYKIKMKTNDEFDILSDRFNDMAKVLQENRKLRDEFVFISAHELRTPVTAIKGYLSMILDKTFGEVPPAIKKPVEIVNNSNERLVQLVNDLLEIARSESGKMKITLAPAEAAENVNIVLNELKSLADKKNIKLNYNEPELGKTMAMADSGKFKEVLTNLIGNAIKYTLTNGDINITHEVKNNMLITHIQDHGMGISPESVKKLFAKFYRVQTNETKDIEGTGLGLFICKEIVERMNGRIWAKSQVGKGSTFSFSLQIATDTAKNAPDKSAPAQTKSA